MSQEMTKKVQGIIRKYLSEVRAEKNCGEELFLWVCIHKFPQQGKETSFLT